MEENIHIVGGMSTNGRVSIASPEYKATAHYKDGQIICNVTRQPWISRFFFKHKDFPLRLPRMMILVIADSIVLKTFFVIFIIASILERFLPPIPDTAVTLFIDQYWWVAEILFLSGFLV